MKSSNYIVDFLVSKGIKHVFGYQGTMIAHFVDSVYNDPRIENHCCYNEQGAGFAAVGYAKTTGKLAVAYSTSGPGAANLVSAIADAYYDSAPVLFFTGQLNTYEYLNIDGLRQNGFQEMNVVSMVKDMTKYCVKLDDINELRYCLEKAAYIAENGRPGPVVIDLPMDMQRQDIDPETMRSFDPEAEGYAVRQETKQAHEIAREILDEINKASAPVILIGNGIVHGSKAHAEALSLAEKLNVPVATSMLARDLMAYDHPFNFGHVGGGYGHRYTNLIVNKKADLIVSFGCSVCKRQTGVNTKKFAVGSKIIRVDIDPLELERKVHDDEVSYLADCGPVIHELCGLAAEKCTDHKEWLDKCIYIRTKLAEFDDSCEARTPNRWIEKISDSIDENAVICCDVGQHQVWTSQSFRIKGNQQLLFSGGHGAMGFSLPASIGAHYASGQRAVAIAGDGAFQMNIQELQWVFREQVPVTIIVADNNSLGLIRQQQDDMLNSCYAASLAEGGFTSPDFCKIAEAYGIDAVRIKSIDEIEEKLKEINPAKPVLVECDLDIMFGAYPKTYFGEEMHNQRPYVDKELLDELMNI